MARFHLLPDLLSVHFGRWTVNKEIKYYPTMFFEDDNLVKDLIGLIVAGHFRFSN